MKKTIIRGTGRHLPERLVTNNDLLHYMNTSDEWIRQRTGIEQRYWVNENDEIGVSDIGFEAAKIALTRSGWEASELDLIIFATLSPDYCFPGSGCLLQNKLSKKPIPAFDIRQQCTGFLYGITMADAFIRSGMAQKILFVGAEIHSHVLDISTRGRDVAVLFGDGAGAVCLEGVETDEPIGVITSSLHADGSFATKLMVEAPSFRLNPFISKELLDRGCHYPVMDGTVIFNLAIERLPEVTKEMLHAAGLTINDIDLVIPHQANLRINQTFQRSMNIPDDKIFNNIQRYGNTTAASIPIALDEAIEMNRIQKGDTLLFIALGAGVTWGGVIYRF